MDSSGKVKIKINHEVNKFDIMKEVVNKPTNVTMEAFFELE
jgi:hypothetical protein